MTGRVATTASERGTEADTRRLTIWKLLIFIVMVVATTTFGGLAVQAVLIEFFKPCLYSTPGCVCCVNPALDIG